MLPDVACEMLLVNAVTRERRACERSEQMFQYHRILVEGTADAALLS